LAYQKILLRVIVLIVFATEMLWQRKVTVLKLW